MESINKGKEESEYRIGTRKSLDGERTFFIMEIFKRGKKIVSFCQGGFLGWDKPNLEGLRDEFNSVREAFFKAVIDTDKFPREYKAV